MRSVPLEILSVLLTVVAVGAFGVAATWLAADDVVSAALCGLVGFALLRGSADVARVAGFVARGANT